jgi:diaminopimelate epimerase
MCGNGLRCIIYLAHRRGYGGDNFIVQTPVGLRAAQVLPNGLVRVAMGEPSFEPAEIPMNLPPEYSNPVEYLLTVSDVTIPHVTSMFTGSTHTVIFVPQELSEETFQTLSPKIEHHAWFPERTSIMWAQVMGDSRLKLRIWERGVGETIACGTGACAAAVAAQVTNRCHGPIEVESRGGVLRIEWEPRKQIYKTGPAAVVYEGVEVSDTPANPERK